MTNGLTTVAGIPSGSGIGSKPPVERGEAKKPEAPEPAPSNCWDFLYQLPDPDYMASLPTREECLDRGLKECREVIRSQHNFCRGCETCSNCLKNGCIPETPIAMTPAEAKSLLTMIWHDAWTGKELPTVDATLLDTSE